MKIKQIACIVFCLSGFSSQADSPKKIERIVSGTGNASEIIYNLGMNDQLVAVDTTSLIPADVMKDKPKIGYRRMLSSEGILAMQPDLLVLAPDAGPKATVEQIKRADVNTITIKNVKSIEGVIADIEMISTSLNKVKEAQPMIDKLKSDKVIIDEKITAFSHKPKIAFMMDAGKKKVMGLGASSAGDYMIAVVGGVNVFADKFKSLKPVSEEAMIESDADMIIIASHGNPKVQAEHLVEASDAYPNLALTKASSNKCVFQVSTMLSLGFGPSFTDSAKEIVEMVPKCINKQADK